MVKTKGVKTAQVSFDTRRAVVEFDESRLSVQDVAAAITGTPHMMGKGMKYSGALLLKVEGMKDLASANKVKRAITKVAGVRKAEPNTKQQLVAVEFAAKGHVTSKQLLMAVQKAGRKARLA